MKTDLDGFRMRATKIIGPWHKGDVYEFFYVSQHLSNGFNWIYSLHKLAMRNYERERDRKRATNNVNSHWRSIWYLQYESKLNVYFPFLHTFHNTTEILLIQHNNTGTSEHLWKTGISFAANTMLSRQFRILWFKFQYDSISDEYYIEYDAWKWISIF